MMLRPGAINNRVVDTSKHGVGFLEDNEKGRVTNFNLTMFKLLLLVRSLKNGTELMQHVFGQQAKRESSWSCASSATLSSST